MGKKKIQTEEERLIQKEKNMQYLKDFFGHVTSGNLFLLLSIGSLLSGIVINFLLSFYEDNGKYIQASYWLYLSFIILLVIGLFIKLTKTEVARIIFMVISSLFLVVITIILIAMYPDNLNNDWGSILYLVSLVLLIVCTISYNMYRVVKKSMYLIIKNIPKISQMDTKDILTIIIVPLIMFLTGLLIK